MTLASVFTTAITPFAKLFGWVLAGCFAFTHSYGLSIILLTLATMLIVFPLTRKGTRGMIQMQLLQPDLLEIRNRYKKTPGMSQQEKLEMNRAQQDEMMALYKERGASPTGGCLPLLLQFPVFIILYNVIRGMTHSVTTGTGSHAVTKFQPLYISAKTQLFQSLVHSQGKADFLGFNLVDSLRNHPGVHGWGVAPFVIVILIAVGLQYVSIWQITNRNANSNVNMPQGMQNIQKFMPIIFLFIYYAFPAGVGLYFIVSSIFRILQQAWMYKHDPVIVASMAALTEQRKNNPPPPPGPKRSFRERINEAADQDASRRGKTVPKGSGSKPAIAKTSAGAAGGAARRPTGSNSGSNRGGSSGTKKAATGAVNRRPAAAPGDGSGSASSASNGTSKRTSTGQRPRPANGQRPTGGQRPTSGQRPAARSGQVGSAASGRTDEAGSPGTRSSRPRRPADSTQSTPRKPAAGERTENQPEKTPSRRPRRPS
jgi:YidC/Oxa1 family membrane protein insertase